jgi:serine/threonine protein kinase
MAPEVIKREEYSLSIDVWSFGILVIELTAGKPPYSDLGIPVAQFQIINSKGKAPRLDE